MIASLPPSLTSEQFERMNHPIRVTPQTYRHPQYVVQVAVFVEDATLDAETCAGRLITREVVLTRVQFADGRRAWIGYDDAAQQWYWYPL